MKIWISRAIFSAGVSALVFSSVAAGVAAEVAKLPYGVGDVLKLSRANVSEEVILKYVQNSGTVYQLGAQDIVVLRDEGVPDRIINAMLDQKPKLVEPTPVPGTAVALNQNTPAYAQPPADQNALSAPVYAPNYIQQPPVVVQPEPSTVYVIPYSSSVYYGGYRPYFSGPYSYWGPRYYGPPFSIGLRFGGGRSHFHGGRR